MKILLLSQWFQPEPFFKGLPFAKALQAIGHDVEVLTGFPNYPDGKLYKGYRVRCLQREVIDGIRVTRVPLYPSHDRSSIRRILNYVSFALSAGVLAPFLIKKPDVVYVYNLVSLGVVAKFLQLIFKCATICDIQDLWPDAVIDSGMMNNRRLIRLLDDVCLRIYKGFDHLTALSPGVKTELARRGIQRSKMSVVYNWCDEINMRQETYDGLTAEKLGVAGSFVVMFAGTMGVGQGLDALLGAAERIARVDSTIKFVFVGGGIERDRLRRVAHERGLSNVLFLERQPPEAMPRVLALADVMVVHLRDLPLYRVTIPSKIQAYMAAAKPILCAVHGDAANLVKMAGAGFVAVPEDAESIAEMTLTMSRLSESQRNTMGENARRYYTAELSMGAGVRRFDAIFRFLRGNENA